VITVEDWAEIRRLHKSEKLSQAEIARQLSLSGITRIRNGKHQPK
jgi:hypothetical protein